MPRKLDWLTVTQAAQLAEVSVERIYQLCRDNRIESKKIGSIRIVKKSSLVLWKQDPEQHKSGRRWNK